MHRALIGLGANLGDREQTLDGAVTQLAGSSGTLTARSSWHETAPVSGPAGQPCFVNGAALLETELAAPVLLRTLQTIENELGRQRSERWAARTIDLDLLLYDNLVLDTPELTLPHPRMAFRRFVLQPAAEIAPDMLHGPTGWTVGRLFEHLVAAPPYLAMAGLPGHAKTDIPRRIAAQSGARLILDPTGGGAETDRIALRAELLDRAAWPLDRWTISDFWFDESLAWMAAQNDDDLRAAAERTWRERRPAVMPPKLLAVLEPAASTAAAPNRYFDAIRELASRPGHGPVIWLSSDDLEGAATELLAALQAMR